MKRHIQFIDGLRALAIVLVFFFHLTPNLLPLGYLGVDIFFVISGFVISLSLYKEFKASGTIHLGKFYLRRIKRLYPALVTMVATTSILYIFIGYLFNINAILKTAVAALFGISNLYYHTVSHDYFFQTSLDPFIHTWSLGVEEQFYFFYPTLLLLLLLTARRFKFNTLYIGGMLLLFSGTLALLYATSFTDNFYWPLARVWELGIGCAVFFFTRTYSLPYPHLLTGVAVGILSTLLIPGVSISQLPAVILALCATTLLIGTGLQTRHAIHRLFALKPVTYIGALSYSLYLWHLPVLYFLHLYTKGLVFYILSITLTGVLGFISYRYIETPLRYKDCLNKPITYGVTLIGTAAVAGFLLIGPQQLVAKSNQLFTSIGTIASESNYIERKNNLGIRVRNDYGMVNWFGSADCENEPLANNLSDGCFLSKQSDTLFYLTGDSHAKHLLPLFASSSIVADLYYTPFDFPLTFSTSTLDSKLSERLLQLESLREQYQEIIYITSVHISDGEHVASEIESAVAYYQSQVSPFATMVYVSPTPIWPAGPEPCVLLGVSCNLNKKHDLTTQQQMIDIIVAQSGYANTYVYNIYDQICPTDQCPIYDNENDFLWYFDEDHVSFEASQSLAPHFDQWFMETVK